MNEIETWLESRIGLNFRSGLERMRQAISLLDHPEENYPIIHVTGTNGKGSTIAFMSQLFVQHEKKVGTFTSPHMVSVHDRICINHEPISDEDFTRLGRQVQEMERQLRQTHDPLSYFEILTLVALLYFKEEQVDVALIEVGIGGLLDTTNVVTGDIAVVTSVGLDHQETLGDSIAAIAEQKTGIFKEKKVAVIGPLTEEVRRVCELHAKKLDVVLYEYGRDFVFKRTIFQLRCEYSSSKVEPSRYLSRRKCHCCFAKFSFIYETAKLATTSETDTKSSAADPLGWTAGIF